MEKKRDMKRFLLIVMIVSMVALPLAACGSTSKVKEAFQESLRVLSFDDEAESAEEQTAPADREETAELQTEFPEESLPGENAVLPAGVYVPVAAETAGIVLPGDLLGEMSFEFRENGKAVIRIEGEAYDATYRIKGKTLTVVSDGEEMVGMVGDDVLVFDDFADSGVKVTLAREETEAAEKRYTSQEAQAIVGSWKSVKVTDLWGNELTDIPADSCTAVFTEDGMATIRIGEKTFGPQAFLDLNGFFMFETDFEIKTELPITWIHTPFGLEIAYVSLTGQYCFTMERVETESIAGSAKSKKAGGNTED